jgi:hypothetical protein
MGATEPDDGLFRFRINLTHKYDLGCAFWSIRLVDTDLALLALDDWVVIGWLTQSIHTVAAGLSWNIVFNISETLGVTRKGASLQKIRLSNTRTSSASPVFKSRNGLPHT